MAHIGKRRVANEWLLLVWIKRLLMAACESEEGVVKVEVEVGAALVDNQHLVDDSGAAGGGVGDIRVKRGKEGTKERGEKGLMEGDRVEGDEGRWEADGEMEGTREGGRLG